MNIAQAKDYIKESARMYLKKDEYGDYRIPIVRQRPIFLLGAPGIGKSAIMEQIAKELNIALVSYSMTHHTRQSALGLPFIKEKEYGGKKVDVSEYTMSEIIASIYETMEETGIKEGILFLDEINCVSETLYPSMLQFLQFKVFGRHRVPDGWIIVTAGNPPQYNKSVREFDVVTLDRLKVLKVTEDYDVWKKYAKEKGIHSAIIGFLDGDKDSFYHIEATAEGNSYVTARGWEDLSDILYMYEESNLRVDDELVSQYLQCDSIVREFTSYYELYNKYKSTFNVEEILNGSIGSGIRDAVMSIPIDERIALVSILIDNVRGSENLIMEITDMIKKLRPAIVKMKDTENVSEAIENQKQAQKKLIDIREKAGTLTADERKNIRRMIAFYDSLSENVSVTYEDVAKAYEKETDSLKTLVNKEKERLKNAFAFISEVFGENSNEMVIFLAELTTIKSTAFFLSTFGSDEYDRYNELLMVGNREANLRQEIEELFGV